MTTPTPAPVVAAARPTLWPAILFGGLIAGTLDITDAFVTNAMLAPTPNPIGLLQGIASGLLGPASFQGGLATAALGLACHFLIALTAAAIYVLASRRLPILVQRPILCGIAFGIGVHLVMQNIVLPLSAIRLGTRPTPWPQIANQYLIHAFGVGVTIALAARRWALPSA